MFLLRKYKPGQENSMTLERCQGPRPCDETCTVIAIGPGARKGAYIVQGVCHGENCGGEDYYGASVLHAVYRREHEGWTPAKLIREAKHLAGYELVTEIVQLARAQKNYKEQLDELRPLVKEIPEVQSLVTGLIKNLESL